MAVPKKKMSKSKTNSRKANWKRKIIKKNTLNHMYWICVFYAILLFITFGALSTLLGLYLASLAMNGAVASLGMAGVSDIAGFPALGLILGVYGLVTTPLDHAISRWREWVWSPSSLRLTSTVRLAPPGISVAPLAFGD